MGTDRPSVSVVIPTRNRAELLAVTLRSALAQQRVNFEVVVVDDGSTDGTAALLAGLHDDRVQVVRNPSPTGPSQARNRGVNRAQGVWVAPLDDDDLWAPDKLARLLEAAQRQDLGWAYSGGVVVERRGAGLVVVSGARAPAPERMPERLLRRNVIPGGGSNVVVRRDLLEAVGVDGRSFDPRLRHMQDWDLWIRLAQAGAPAVVDRPLVAYRLHPGNQSLDSRDTVDCARRIEARYAALRGGQPLDWPAIYRYLGFLALRSGARGAALRHYLSAARAGDRGALARAAVGLVHPAVGRRALLRSGPDPVYTAPAQQWLRAAGLC